MTTAADREDPRTNSYAEDAHWHDTVNWQRADTGWPMANWPRKRRAWTLPASGNGQDAGLQLRTTISRALALEGWGKRTFEMIVLEDNLQFAQLGLQARVLVREGLRLGHARRNVRVKVRVHGLTPDALDARRDLALELLPAVVYDFDGPLARSCKHGKRTMFLKKK